MVRKGVKQPPRDPLKRLGKVRGHLIDVLDAAGGASGLEEAGAAMHMARPRELVRAKTKADGRNGPVIMLLQSGIVEWVCDVTTRREILRLTPNWLEALENARRLGKEIETDELAAWRYRSKSAAFHSRSEVRPTEHWTNTGADGAIEHLRSESAAEASSAEPPPLSPLAAALRAYLERSPRDACQPPGWLGLTLWALDLFEGKPTPQEAAAALDELGGDEYRRLLLARVKGAA
jgi:hypothetical protein